MHRSAGRKGTYHFLILGGKLGPLSDLVDDSSVEHCEEDEGQEGGQGHPGPVDVVELVVGVESQLGRPDVRRVIGPASTTWKSSNVVQRKHGVLIWLMTTTGVEGIILADTYPSYVRVHNTQ